MIVLPASSSKRGRGKDREGERGVERERAREEGCEGCEGSTRMGKERRANKGRRETYIDNGTAENQRDCLVGRCDMGMLSGAGQSINQKISREWRGRGKGEEREGSGRGRRKEMDMRRMGEMSYFQHFIMNY